MEVRVILITVPDELTAENFAKTLVERKLAACVNILPQVRSIYHWEGKVCDQKELLLFVKTSANSVPALVAALKELHPYDTPEFIVFEPSFVNKKYADWIASLTGDKG